MTLISVVIPCFNHGRYIDETIKSVLAQTYQDFEIIVVNDGSTDEYTKNILSVTTWPKTSVFHISNSGLPAARNYGIRIAKGEIIVALDADDLFLPEFFEKGLEILNKEKHIGVVSSYIETFGYKQGLLNYYQSGGLEKYIAENNTTACAMFRKECWENVGGYDESMRNGYEDWEFWISVTSLGWKVHIIPEVLFKYRKSEISMLTESDKMRPELIKYIFEKHKNELNEYLADAVYVREKQIFHLKKQLEWERKYYIDLVDSFKKSKSYIFGSILISPFSIMKKFLSKSINCL